MLKDHTEKDWLPGIIKCIASENIGTKEIADEIQRHRDFMIINNLLKEKREENYKIRIKEIAETLLKNELWMQERESFLNESLQKVADGTTSPYQVAETLFNDFKQKAILREQDGRK